MCSCDICADGSISWSLDLQDYSVNYFISGKGEMTAYDPEVCASHVPSRWRRQ